MLLWILLLTQSSIVNADGKPILWTRGSFESLKLRVPSGMFDYAEPDALTAEYHAQGHLRRGERETLFRKLELHNQVQKMDEMDRDILVMSAKALTLPELYRLYPSLARPKLRRLKLEVEKFK